VVVLGSGLIGGRRVPPLLASRLDRGGEVYERLAARGGDAPPLLVTSGGQGPDEELPESHAMAAYLVERGFPADRIRREDRSRTTEENLRFSREVATGALPVGMPPGHLLVATNEYHAPRTALLARRIGVDADVVGGSTAGYYVPSAYLREFVAVMVMNLRTQLLLAVPGLLFSTGLTAVLVLERLNAG